MDVKYLSRILVTIAVILLILGVIYYGVYMPYKWELTGVVEDTQGVKISGVEVTLLDIQNNKTLTTITEDNGAYRFSSNILKEIPSGVYELKASKELPDGTYYVGYTGMIQLSGTSVEQNLPWIRSDEVEILANYDKGLEFVADQVRPDPTEESQPGAGVFWVKVDLTGLGDEYGIQIENAPGNNISMNLMKDGEIVKPGKTEINDSKVVDVVARADGAYPKFLNTMVFAGLETAKLREGVYRLTASQGDVIFAPITTGVFAEDVFDKDGNWASSTNYSDMTIMSQGYFDRYFEVVYEKEEGEQQRIEYKCKDTPEVWNLYKASCTTTQHCDNRVAMKYDQKCR